MRIFLCSSAQTDLRYHHQFVDQSISLAVSQFCGSLQRSCFLDIAKTMGSQQSRQIQHRFCCENFGPWHSAVLNPARIAV